MEGGSACEAPAASDLSRGRTDFGSHRGGTEVSFGPSTIEKLAELGAILEGRVSFRDSYYDVPDWCLTRGDHWLREREGVPGQNWTCVNKAVEELGLEVFANFVTTRHKYRAGDLHVDLDEADFGYAVGEVEAVVQRLEDIPEALEKIQKFCRQLGLEEKTAVPGKMSVYLHRFRPAHYKALTEAGIVRKVKSATERQDGKA